MRVRGRRTEADAERRRTSVRVTREEEDTRVARHVNVNRRMPTGARARALGAALVVVIVVTGATLATTRPWQRAATCAQTRDDPNWSVARRWDEALLDAVRRALPAPTVHARNLFHTRSEEHTSELQSRP